ILVSLTAPVLPGPGTDPEEASGAELFTFDAMQQVEISAVVVDVLTERRTGTSAAASVTVSGDDIDIQQQPTPVPELTGVSPKAFLLALDPQDALVLKHIKDIGGIIDIVLRAPTATVRFELSPVMADYLRDRFELTITR
ncbi:MAG: hypothetical protein ACE5LB_12050, partial [Acidiferrobacterales bacterium]